MSIRIRNLTPQLAVLFCLALVPVAKATDEPNTPAKAACSHSACTQPKLAEQDVWKRWQLAHNARKARTEARLTSSHASASHSGGRSRVGSTPPADEPSQTK